MEKHLVTIEFRYSSAPDKFDSTSQDKVVTIGVYDDFDEACKEGNKALELLESKFDIHTFPQGNKAKKERFSKNGGCFGSKNTLVSNLAYLKTPFQFFAKIETLKLDSLEDAVNEVVDSVKGYRKYKASIED